LTKPIQRSILSLEENGMAQKLMNVRQTAEILGVHENTVRNWEERGILPAVRLPGSGFRRFDPSTVEQMRKEIWAHLAPADEGPVITPRAAISGHIHHGDLEE
jgi:excisionase family DNA binding protein